VHDSTRLRTRDLLYAGTVVIQENVPLAPLTTLKVGGPARYYVRANSEQDVLAAVGTARERGWPLFVLGGGSNLVIADAGWPGLVLHMAVDGLDHRRENSHVVFEAGAGEEWDKFVAYAVKHDCAGVECMSGIPGTVGGTPVQNVGAYGQEVSETISEVRALDTERGQMVDLCGESCGFAYRSSIFNAAAKGRYIITRVSYALAPGGAPKVEYADLKNFFSGRGGARTLAEVRDAVRQIRLRKAMLIVNGDEDSRSAGSFFKNPLISQADYEQLAARATARGLAPPVRFPTPQGVKVPAGWLVEQAGFAKGTARGRVGISRRHALAIVNRGGATAADVLVLKDEIQRRVEDVFGVQLQPEPVFVGFGPL
jgi:UDP-N-acetylmuramate dehydrogenase